MNKTTALITAGTLGLTFSATLMAADDYITLASTTSTENSGLFDAIIPHSAKRPGLMCTWSPWAPARRSKLAAVAMRIACWFTTPQVKKSLWPMLRHRTSECNVQRFRDCWPER